MLPLPMAIAFNTPSSTFASRPMAIESMASIATDEFAPIAMLPDANALLFAPIAVLLSPLALLLAPIAVLLTPEYVPSPSSFPAWLFAPAAVLSVPQALLLRPVAVLLFPMASLPSPVAVL